MKSGITRSGILSSGNSFRTSAMVSFGTAKAMTLFPVSVGPDGTLSARISSMGKGTSPSIANGSVFLMILALRKGSATLLAMNR